MGLTKLTHEIQERLPDELSEFSWQRAVAAGSLVAGAVLFLTGHRKAALIVAASGVTVGILEHPEAAREIWDSLPGYLKNGQDMLSRVEEFIDAVVKQGNKLRSAVV